MVIGYYSTSLHAKRIYLQKQLPNIKSGAGSVFSWHVISSIKPTQDQMQSPNLDAECILLGSSVF